MVERIYIDLDALIDVQLFDDEHEEWNWHRMTVRDYLGLACDDLPTAADVVSRKECDYWHEKCSSYEQTILRLAQNMPQIVRCKDCKWHEGNLVASDKWLPCMEMLRDGQWFCADGERREDA